MENSRKEEMMIEREKTILLVEDEVIIAMSEKMKLEDHGFRVMTARTGEQAVTLFSTNPGIDLVLMDIDLGKGMDGTETAMKILEIRDIPVVFLSSHTEPEVVRKTERISSYGYVIKDSEETILIASIKMAFRLFDARMNEKRKEEAMMAERDFSSFLINSTPAFFVSIGHDSTIKSMNNSMLQALGYTAEEVIGKNYLSLMVPESEHQMLSETFGRLLRLKEKTYNENRILTKDGRELLCEWYGTPMVKGDEVESFIGLGIDITTRRQIEKINRIQRELIKSLNTCIELEEGLEQVLKSVLQLDCIDSGAIYIRNPSDNSLDLMVYRGVSAEFAERVSHIPADSPQMRMMLDGKFRSGRFPENIQELQGVPEAEELCSYAAFPIINNGQLIAMLNVASHRDVVIPDYTLKSLENITVQISGTILRLRTNTALRENEELFHSFVLQSKDGIVIVDEKGTIIEWNESQEKITGITRSEALNQPIWEMQFRVFPPEFKNQDNFEIARKKTLEGLKEGTGLKRTLEEEIHLADGTRRIIQTILFGIPGKRNTLAGAICRDISEQKRAEKENKILLQKNIILLKEVHHRIKNNISTIEGLLSMHARSARNPEALSILQDAVGRVRSMSILYDNLMISENYSNVSSRSYFENLIDMIIDIFPDAGEISINRDIKDFTVSSKYIIPLGIIVNELITNALKHAFTGREDGILQILLDSDGKKITVTIADNGKGLPSGFDIERENGFGFMLVGLLVRQIDATLTIDCEKGTKIRIECLI